QTRHVHAGRVETVDRPGHSRIESQTASRDRRGHEQDQQRAHAVIAEPLPHFGEEERRQSARMTEERAVGPRRGNGGNGHGPKLTMIVSPCAVSSSAPMKWGASHSVSPPPRRGFAPAGGTWCASTRRK